jgi:eukaryotic-like serine/threonine-protein kinase
MASVLLCRDERLGRQVAVKRLHADSPAEVEQRFVHEARIGAVLNHPNLVSVFDTATDGESVLIVMEYVPGEALSQTLKRGPLRAERVALMVRDLGAALDHIHGQGVVHRDVKPGNVLLRKDGVTKLVDLGIATASDQTRLTSSGMVLGTATYMAPEQLEGGEAGPAADVYALALVAYEALTGKRARTGRTPMEIAHRIATSPPPEVRERLPDASPAAAELLKQGMARDPAERPSSAGELASRLGRALEQPAAPQQPTARTQAATAPTRAASGPPSRTETAPASGPVWAGGASRRAKRPVGAIALALALLVLAVAAVVGTVLAGGGEDDGSGSQSAQKSQKSQKQSGRDGQARRGAGGDADAPAAADEPATAEQPSPEEPTAETETETEPEPSTSVDPARGAELNDQGFSLMQQGDFAGAVPLLEQAVASYPEDSREITYAYALFNLGKSLNRSGRPEEAIPYLEKRLTWPDQRETVQSELDDAQARAG